MTTPTSATRGSNAPDWRQQLMIWSGLVVSLFVLSWAAIVYGFGDWSSRSNFGQSFGAIGALFTGLAFAGVVIALVLQNHGLQLQLQEISRAHEWNRRRAAYEIITESSLGKFGELRRLLEVRIDIYNPNQTWATLQPPLSRQETLQLDAALNYLENLCLSVKNEVLDEEIIYEALSEILVGYWRWAKPYIDDCRKISPAFFREIDPFEKQWRERSNKEKP